MLATETRPAWVEAVSRYLGDPAEPATATIGELSREIWDWRCAAGVCIIVDRFRGTTAVEVHRDSERQWEIRAAQDLGDEQIVDLLRASGVLPRHVPAVDHDQETLWLSPSREVRFVSGEDADAFGRAAGFSRLYAEDVAS